jgi:glycosyltransferase involved in cell wall biosynthesis
MFKLWLVVPCYNEEEVLPETAKRLDIIISGLMEKGKIAPESRICFVNDGSKDKTWEIIGSLYNEKPVFAGVNLARNRGHQNALLAGLMFARNYADAVISLDADLQDDVAAIEKFVDEYLNGSDIVYGVRSSRSSDSFFKRSSAESFYKLMKFMGVDIVFNHADYRLMSKRALDALSQFEEVNLFLRGIAPQIGYKTSTVEYVRAERFAGESKYPLKKMLAFAFEGITSFSVKPLRIATILGCGAFFISLLMLLYVLIQFFSGNTVSGWASLGVSIWALGGLQLLMIGIVGEYIGKVYMEAKHRPKFIIEAELLR